MCGRFTFDTPPELLANIFALKAVPEISANYKDRMFPVIRQIRDRNVITLMKWGLVPSWANDPAIGIQLTNIRSESFTEKPSYRHAIRYCRCIVPCTGYISWQYGGATRTPELISMQNGRPLGLAGIWEEWNAPDGSLLDTFTILTTCVNRVVGPTHARMPVILAPDVYSIWLNKHITDPVRLETLYQPFPADG